MNYYLSLKFKFITLVRLGFGVWGLGFGVWAALRDVGTFVYRVRATNAGTFNTPPAYAEGMYETTLQGRGNVGQLEITKP